MKTGTLVLSFEVQLPRGPNNGVARREMDECTTAVVESGQAYEAINQDFRVREVPVMHIDCTQEDATKIAARYREKNPGAQVKAEWRGPVKL